MNIHTKIQTIEPGHKLTTVFIGDDPVAHVRMRNDDGDLIVVISEDSGSDVPDIENVIPGYFHSDDHIMETGSDRPTTWECPQCGTVFDIADDYETAEQHYISDCSDVGQN